MITNTFSNTVGGTVINVGLTPVVIRTMLVRNTTAATAYLQMFPTPAADVTLGTTVARDVIPIPASSGIAIDVPGGWKYPNNALSIACTTSRTNSTAAICDVWILHGG